MLRGGWVIQEGTAVGFLLVWCGRSATTLVAAGHILNKLWGKNGLDQTEPDQKTSLGMAIRNPLMSPLGQELPDITI